jgi:hypothetical protein
VTSPPAIGYLRGYQAAFPIGLHVSKVWKEFNGALQPMTHNETEQTSMWKEFNGALPPMTHNETEQTRMWRVTADDT